MTMDDSTTHNQTLWSSVRVTGANRGGRSQTDSGPELDPGDPRAESMSREQMVDRILSINPSATLEFLDQFESEDLHMYLRHLLNAQEPRGPLARWARPNDAPAIWSSRRRY